MSKRRRRRDATRIGTKLGEFTYFPDTIHGRGLVSFKCPVVKIQRAIVETMLSLNGREERRRISVSGFEGEVRGKMGFEVGVANDVFFERLDEDIAGKLIQYISSDNDCQVMDFLLVITYHYSREGRMLPVRFDHHHLRFSFKERAVEVFLHHIRGTRRMPLDELFRMIFDELRRRSKQERLGEVRVEGIRTL